MLKSGLCDYSDDYILLNGIITITREPADAIEPYKRLDKRNKEVMFKNCASFTDCLSEINSTRVYDAKDLDAVIQRITYPNIVIIFQTYLDVYGNIIEMIEIIF